MLLRTNITRYGGIFTTAADITALGQSILKSSLLQPQATRAWLKPVTHTSNLLMSVGMPWEIHRMELPLSPATSRTRIVDLYTKNGALGAYASYLVLDPQHNMGYSILIAGSTPSRLSTLAVLADFLAANWIPAFEQAARSQAESNFAGTYVHDAPTVNSSLTITTQNDRPGLGVSNWTRNGLDMLELFGGSVKF